MDSFERYRSTGKAEEILSCNDYLQVYTAVQDLDYLTATSLLFSEWRWVTYWAYIDGCHFEYHTEFFKALLEKIFELCK